MDTNVYISMPKKLLGLILLLVSFSQCVFYKRSTVADRYHIVSPTEVTYTTADKQKHIIKDSLTLFAVYDIITTAESTPGKFIIREQLEIKAGDTSLVIGRNNEWLKIGGHTFKLSHGQNKRLDALLNDFRR